MAEGLTTYIGCGSLYTAYGDRKASFLGLDSGKSALREDGELGIIAGRIPHYPVVEGCTRLESLIITCVREVCEESGVRMDDEDTQLLISSTKGNVELLAGHSSSVEDIPVGAFPGAMAEKLGGILGCARRPLLLSNACISGASAFVVARRLILGGKCRRVVIVGCDLLCEFISSGFASFKSLSPSPCRPYDAARDGLNLGEACAAVLMTSLRSERGENPVVMEGGFISDDANHISGPSRTGEELAIAIRKAMEESAVSAERIGFVNTHGTATVYNDEMESKAVSLAGLSDKPLNSIKGYIGHTLGASGIVDLLVCAEELRRGWIYPTAGFSSPGVSCPVGVSTARQAFSTARCVKTASGFGGCNVAVVLALESEHEKIAGRKHIYNKKDIAVSDGEPLVHEGEGFEEWIRAQYHGLGESYPKFYKMSDLDKVAYVACGKLLAGRKLSEECRAEDIALVLANRASSLDADLHHQRNIESGDGASPAVFVYTLPNVAAGELCIRHGFKGENSFFVQESDDGFCREYARLLLEQGQAKKVVWGWCEQLGKKCRAELHLSEITD